MTTWTPPGRAAVAKTARTAAGLLIVVIGLALIPLPGPGLLVVIAGLALLARDHEWAARWLDRARAQATRAKNAVIRRRHDPRPTDRVELTSVPTAHLEPVDVVKGRTS